jgi:streptomycin 6-kinase
VAYRAELPDGTPAVLKLVFPHREAEHEADALAAWDGDGAVRLLAHDPERNALLLERCEPGTSPAGSEAALDVLIALLPRLWIPAGPPFRPLADEAARWASTLRDEWESGSRRYERRLLDAALDALGTLAPTQGEQVLLHQDLHGGNVLAAQREPWLAIDPKPLTGERELSVAPIVRSRELGPDLLRRFDRVTAELGLDRERARGWTIAQTLAWSDGGAHEGHVETARLLLERR